VSDKYTFIAAEYAAGKVAGDSFDSISHSALMDRMRMRIKDKRVLALVKAFLKAGILTEFGDVKDTHTGTPQGGILSPLLANIALSVLDEHLMGPWKPGGSMSTEGRRAGRRAKGLPTWRLVRYCDDFVVLVNGNQAGTEALREEVAQVLAPMGLRLSPAKTRVVFMGEGFDFLGFHIQWRRKKGTSKWYVYTFIGDRPIRSVKAKIRALTRRTSQQDLGYVLTGLNLVMHGWANYFKYAVAKNVFAMLDNFAWWRAIRMLQVRHHWNWKDVRRRFTTLLGRWLPITAGEIELRRIAAIPVTRYRWRGSKIPNSWVLKLTTPDGRGRGEPVALRGARRVRREVRRNGPGAIPAPRSGPTQRNSHNTRMSRVPSTVTASAT
jgi:RNA-directed DNA polymerase